VAAPSPVRRRPRPPPFRPRFTLALFYVFALVLAWGLAFALPDLLAAARDLPPGPAELTPEELAQAREVAREALAGRVHSAVAAALVTFGVLAWRGWLPGLREPRAR
jgi:hypothetical protein